MRKPGLRAVLRDAWRLAAPYFRSDQRWSARLLLAAIVALNLAQVGVDVVLNFWRGSLYDSLQQKNYGDFIDLTLLWRNNEAGFMPSFLMIVTFYVPIAVYSVYLNQLLQIRWRTWMTGQFLTAWTTDRAYYTISLQPPSGEGPHGTDNPDQRIAEDIDKFTTDTLALSIDLLSTIVSLVSFAQILWSLSGAITLLGVQVPGYLLYVAVLYALTGSVIAHYVGRPLAALEFLHQRAEADFRFGLMRVRENAEGIALYAGHVAERLGLMHRFDAVVANWRRVMSRRKKLNSTRFIYMQLVEVFPLLIASPRYFSGQIELGALMRISGAFSQVQGSLSWFVNSYPALATWRATIDRLAGFQAALGAAGLAAQHGVRLTEGAPGAITATGLDLGLPNGRSLLHSPSLALAAGQVTAITGPSGAGKSTLFRALAGIWPFGHGTIAHPPGTRLFLPQRPYIPLGTLRHAVTYPAVEGMFPDDAVNQALTDAGLAPLIPELDSDQPWSQRLSGGEQQRLAIARALLIRPDWLFLDEATASLDPVAEAALYAILRAKLPATTLVSIAHRPEVARWHDRELPFDQLSRAAEPH